VNTDRKAGFDRRFEDRPITPLAEKLAGARRAPGILAARLGPPRSLGTSDPDDPEAA